ncbi:MAG: adenosine deaminase [Nocardioides sp.]|nr:adenosine deaminase [Nocardioides sp.]
MRDLDALPKVHVHVHLDGSFPRAAVQRLARRRGRSFTAPRTFASVHDFFSAYGEVPPLVESLGDLADLCRSLVLAEAAHGVVYLEPAIEPQLYAPRLGSLHDVTAAIIAALQTAADECGIQAGANLTINTDQDLPIADDLVLVAAEFAGKGVTALGTAGFVEPAGLARFRAHADHARTAGLQVVSHAGQTGGPDSVLEALDELGATRISHGIHAARSTSVLDRLAREQIVCDVCPVSNVRLGVVADLATHPAPTLRAAGVPLTLNADDELWFGKSVTDQYRVAREAWNWSDEALAEVARTGALVPGLSDDTRDRLLSSVDEWLSSSPTERQP